MDKIESFCIDMDSRKADYMVEQLQDFDISESKRAVAVVDIEAINHVVGTSADKGKPFFELKGHIKSIEGSFHFPESDSDIHLKLMFSDEDSPEVCYLYNISDSRTEMAELARKGYFEKDYVFESPAIIGLRSMPIHTTIYKLNDPKLEAPIFAVKIENALANIVTKTSCGFDLVSMLPTYEDRPAPKQNAYQIFAQPDLDRDRAIEEAKKAQKDNIRIINKEDRMSIERAAEVNEQELKEQKKRELFEASVAVNGVDTYTETKRMILKAAEEKERKEAEERRQAELKNLDSEASIPDKIGGDGYESEEERRKKAQLERNANIDQAEAANIDTGYSDAESPDYNA